MHQREINRSATQIKRYILARCPRRRLPRTERGWLRLYSAFGLAVGSSCRVPVHFRAQLKYDHGYGDWLVLYNACHSPAARMRYLAHELAEYLAITGEVQQSLFDDDNPRSRIRSYDGGDAFDVRHRVAERFVYLCFR